MIAENFCGLGGYLRATNQASIRLNFRSTLVDPLLTVESGP